MSGKVTYNFYGTLERKYHIVFGGLNNNLKEFLLYVYRRNHKTNWPMNNNQTGESQGKE